MDIFTKVFDGLLNVQRSLGDLLDWTKARFSVCESSGLQLSGELYQRFESVQKEVSEVSETLLFPAHKFAEGRPLSEEEFHMLMGQKILTIERGPGFASDYEFFMCFYYQDDDSEGYINIKSPLPQKGCKRRLRLFGEIEPEKVRIKRLRDEQKKFFENNFPEIFSRFCSD
jgi:hypothetical protein